VGRTFLSAAGLCGGQECPPYLIGTGFAPTLNQAVFSTANVTNAKTIAL
jgi:tartrate dehydratase alpha subunit/fumarate hydratase class I-like protein